MELHVAREILEQVHYQDWTFDVFREGDTLFLQVHFTAPCACRSNRGNLRHRCRKWRISPRSTKSELVQTAFLAVRTAEEHEIRERFKYRGRSIYSPHYDVEKLVEIYDARGWDMRVNSFDAHPTIDESHLLCRQNNK